MFDDDSDEEDGGASVGFSFSSNGFIGGMGLIVLAIVLNFILDTMSPEEIAGLPWYLAMAFESRGKLGVTVVLCSIGLGIIAWDYFVRTARKEDPNIAFSGSSRRQRVAAPPVKKLAPARAASTADGEELPMAEEIPEAGAKPQAGKTPKIAARPGTFAGSARTGGPIGDDTPDPADVASGGGAIVLSTAKYLNTANLEDDANSEAPRASRGRPDFRKGTTRDKSSE